MFRPLPANDGIFSEENAPSGVLTMCPTTFRIQVELKIIHFKETNQHGEPPFSNLILQSSISARFMEYTGIAQSV
jgi:hypothetical protein